jgi:hypothetical protein
MAKKTDWINFSTLATTAVKHINPINQWLSQPLNSQIPWWGISLTCTDSVHTNRNYCTCLFFKPNLSMTSMLLSTSSRWMSIKNKEHQGH